MKSLHQVRIEMMMVKAGQAIPVVPTMPDYQTRRLRARLILEEALETLEALGVDILAEAGKLEFKKCYFQESITPPNLEQIADGCADISVVTIGTLSACGISDADLLNEVDMNNLKKFGPGGYRDENGKWIKPLGHRPPEILEILFKQGYRNN